MNNIISSACSDELDNWFNELDEKTIEIINNDLIKEDLECNPNDLTSSEIGNTKMMMDEDDDEIMQTTKDICIDDILNKDPSTLMSNEIILHECSISYFVQVLVEGSTNKNKTYKISSDDLTLDKLSTIIEYFQWISLASEVLAKRIGQELLVYNHDYLGLQERNHNNKPLIIRSSYNFCTKNTQCKNFYSKQNTPSCREHHYVHSILKYDIDSVISFLTYITKNNLDMTKDEIDNLYLSIKTICFVTRHMAKEIRYIDHFTKNNSEYFHRNNPIEISRHKHMHKKSWNIPENSYGNTTSYQNNYSSKNFHENKQNKRYNQFNRQNNYGKPINNGFNKTFGGPAVGCCGTNTRSGGIPMGPAVARCETNTRSGGIPMGPGRIFSKDNTDNSYTWDQSSQYNLPMKKQGRGYGKAKQKYDEVSNNKIFNNPFEVLSKVAI